MPRNDCKPLPPISEKYVTRFWSKVDKRGPDECWPWMAGCDRKGYGNFSINMETFQSHRVAMFLYSGKDPYPFHVCHTCDNPPCCNGAHYFTGNVQTNTADRHAKKRDAAGDRNGARLHPEKWWQRGELHKRPGAKITDEQVMAIRELRKQGALMKSIAAQFSLSRSNISMIVSRKTWAHLP